MKARTLVALLTAALISTVAQAQYPERPVTIVSPYIAGGGSDLIARELAAHLQRKTGKAFIVENRPGAGATIGTAHVRRAAPDGYTLLLGSTSSQIMVPETMKTPPYDGVNDFTPIGQVVRYPGVLVGRLDGPRTLQELLEKGRTSSLTWGSFGVGGGNHLIGTLFMQSQKLNGVHVPYRGGGATSQALLAGEIDFVFDSYLSAASLAQAGRTRILGVGARERLAALPNVPTMAEAGVPGFEETSIWQALLGPKGLPRDIVEFLNAEVREFAANPDFRKRMEAQGAIAVGDSIEDFQKTMARDGAFWRGFIRENKIQVEE